MFVVALMIMMFALGHAQVDGIPGLDKANEPVSPVVTIPELLQNPAKFEGKRVWVHGYLHVRFEDVSLYASKEDADYLRGWRAIWLYFADTVEFRRGAGGNPKSPNAPKDLDSAYVYAQGVFDAKETGHMMNYSGGLRDVSILQQERRFYDGKTKLSE